ncbi:MAG TPA: molybdopterin molybdotransferase MoeA [Chitinophagales bacterium]|nr:molybdopterin molybdotransferase MoeA [Chitinophagales bacterium]
MNTIAGSITVLQAEQIVLSELRDFGSEKISFTQSLGRVLAEDIFADRDFPPYNRVTMDGIAIRYLAFDKGIKSFNIKATQAAGDVPIEISNDNECVEIMTGAALPFSVDTVIRYEDLEMKNGIATLLVDGITPKQNIHFRGIDKKQNEVVAAANQIITPAIINMAAAIGKNELLVKKLPRVVIISSGDELVEVNETPSPFQVRRSNNYSVQAVLQQYKLNPDMLRIPDDAAITKQKIGECIGKYDVLIISGAISAGKFDYVPKALEELSVKKLFHKVRQRPGGPFWFGKHENGMLVFALPGNPVSTFMCLHRYFFLWLQSSWGVKQEKQFAMLDEDFTFTPQLQYFLQVKLRVNEEGRWLATPVMGNGSGDFANLVDTDSFMELPLERNNFTKGEVFRVWKFRS